MIHLIITDETRGLTDAMNAHKLTKNNIISILHHENGYAVWYDDAKKTSKKQVTDGK